MKQQKSRKGTRIVKRRTPKGRTSIHYLKQKPKKATCARCRASLGGVPRAIPSRLKKMTRSQRRVSRKFGGVLCSKCVRVVEKYKARLEDGYVIKRDLTIEKYLPKGWYASLSVEAKGAERAEAVREAVEEVEETKPEKEVKKVAKKPAKKAVPKKETKKAAKKPAKKTAAKTKATKAKPKKEAKKKPTKK